jgi:hypothetical protein
VGEWRGTWRGGPGPDCPGWLGRVWPPGSQQPHSVTTRARVRWKAADCGNVMIFDVFCDLGLFWVPGVGCRTGEAGRRRSPPHPSHRPLQHPPTVLEECRMWEMVCKHVSMRGDRWRCSLGGDRPLVPTAGDHWLTDRSAECRMTTMRPPQQFTDSTIVSGVVDLVDAPSLRI